MSSLVIKSAVTAGAGAVRRGVQSTGQLGAFQAVQSLDHGPSKRYLSALSQTKSQNILITGVNGRLGPLVRDNLADRGVSVIGATSRPPAPERNDSLVHLDLVHHDRSQMKRLLKQHNVDCVVNLATAFGVKPELAMAVNAYGAKTLAEATGDLDIPMVHTSTVLAFRPEINIYDHPYAFSKREGDLFIENMEHVSILYADTLLADPNQSCSQVEMSFMASFPGVNVQLDAEEQTIQPTTYEAASQAVANAALMAINGEKVPENAVLGGEPVQLRDFIRMVNPKALVEVLVRPESMTRVANLVRNGVLDPEFLSITMLAQETGIPRHPTAPFQQILGSQNVPTPEEVAASTRARINFKATSKMVAAMWSGAQWGSTWAGVLAIPSLRVTIAPEVPTEDGPKIEEID